MQVQIVRAGFSPEDACYSSAVCERQSDGLCGWTQTTELQSCLDKFAPYDPCENKLCGDPCRLCAPSDTSCVETADLKVCNENGECGSGATQCEPPEDCNTLGCPTNQQCVFCSDGFECIAIGATCSR